jgi:hypothetical protein
MALTDYRYDSETRGAMRWMRFGIGALVLFIVSAVFSCTELKYSVSGKKVMADVLNVTPAPAVGPQAVTVLYQFTDDAGKTQQSKYTYERGGFTQPADGKIEIVYLPSWPESNLPTNRRRWWAVWTFLGLTAVLIALGAKVYIETAREIRE